MPEINPTDEFDSLSSMPLPGLDPDGGAVVAEHGAQTLRERLEKAEARIAELQLRADELTAANDRYLRALADAENARKRIERFTQERSDEGRRELLKRLLPVVDNLERAEAYCEAGMSPDQILEGVLATLKQLTELLQAEKVAPIESVGKPFDPNTAEAIATRPAPDMPENTVLDETRKGYKLGSNILRPAQVIVSKAEPKE